MRLKDALETEKAVLVRNHENRNKAIESYKEIERVLRKELQQTESEISKYRAAVEAKNAELINRDQALQRINRASEQAIRAQEEAEAISGRRNAEFAEESKLRQEMQEKSDKLQRELDRCKKQLATSVGLSSSKKKGMGGDDVQVEYLNVSGWIPLVVDMPTSCCTLV
jgi:chromosome segregation ATPase